MNLPFVDADLPEGVMTVRRDLCLTCPTPCAQQHALEHYGKKASICPLPVPRWSHYGRLKPRGLGDAVAMVAQPIAKAIDAIAGTNIQQCGACKKRQEALNRIVPSL